MAGPDGEVTLKELRDLVDRLTAAVGRLRRTGTINRRLIYVTIASLVLDLGLTTAVVVVAAKANHASGTATTAVREQKSACELGNRTNAKRVIFFDELIHGTPAQQTQSRRLVADLFPQRQC